MSYNKYLPNTKGIGEQFWAGLKNKRFLIQKCQTCENQIFYPRVVCPHCGSENPKFIEHSGRGSIYSYTVVHRTRLSGFEDEVPYVIALVALDGGGNIMTNIIDNNLNNIKIGSSVKVKFASVTEEITLPLFELV